MGRNNQIHRSRGTKIWTKSCILLPSMTPNTTIPERRRIWCKWGITTVLHSDSDSLPSISIKAILSRTESQVSPNKLEVQTAQKMPKVISTIVKYTTHNKMTREKLK